MLEIWPKDGSPATKRAATAAFITGPVLDLAFLPLLLVQAFFYLHSVSKRIGSPSNSSVSTEYSKVTDFLKPWYIRIKESVLWDKRSLLVLFLVAASIFKSIAAFISLLDIESTPPTEWIDLLKTWPAATGPLGTAFIGVVVQIFYIHRLNSLLRAQTGRVFGSLWFRISLEMLVGILFFLALTFAVALTLIITSNQWTLFPKFATAHLLSTCIGDILLTMSTIACFCRTGHKVPAVRDQYFMRRIARFTVMSAAIPSFLALLNIALLPLPPSVSRWHIVPNFVLGKLYVCSLVWTLQYRQRIIDERNSPLPSNPQHVKCGCGHEEEAFDAKKDVSSSSHGGNFLNRPSMLAQTIQLTVSQSIRASTSSRQSTTVKNDEV